jgi:phage terminase large subunit-like protein
MLAAPIALQADAIASMADLVGRVARAVLEAPEGEEARGLLDFIPHVSPRFKRPEHLRPLIELLERAHQEPLRVLVSVPPRHGKTEAVLHSLAYILQDDPTALLGYVSYEASLARSKSRSARDYAQTTGIVLREDASSLQEWLTPEGGGLRAGGIGGPLTGHGFRVLVIDDPIKNRVEAESGLIRQRNYDWLTSTAMTRLEPDGSMIIVHTRWHEDDLIGRCLKQTELYHATNGAEGELWVHINLQAIDDDTGKALWPERWPKEKLLRRKAASGEYDWASLYQGRPRPKDSKPFGRLPATYERLDLTGKRLVIGGDCAATRSTRANWSVAVVYAYWWELDEVHGDQLFFDWVEVVRLQDEVPKVAAEFGELQKRVPADFVVEGSGVGKGVAQTMRALNPKLELVEVTAVADKYLRAQLYAQAWQAGRVRIPAYQAPGLHEFVSVHRAFTGLNDPADDDVDAGAHAFNHAMAAGPFYDTVSQQQAEDDDDTDGYRFGDQRGFG